MPPFGVYNLISLKNYAIIYIEKMRKEIKIMTHNIDKITNMFEDILDSIKCPEIDEFLKDPSYHTWHELSVATRDCLGSVRFSSGCTRCVIIKEGCPYVFKIQFDFDDDIDYGRNEAWVYNKAKEAHLEQYFAWTARIGTYGAAEVYAMEYCEVNLDKVEDESFNYHAKKYQEEYGEEYNGDDYGDHEGMFEYAASVDGADIPAVEQLLYDLDVNDCHAGNWGYRGNLLVLTDYAGFGHKIIREENNN